jgi:hypothetical protein
MPIDKSDLVVRDLDEAIILSLSSINTASVYVPPVSTPKNIAIA